MRANYNRCLLLAGILLSAILALGLIFRTNNSQPPVDITLSDGSQIRILGLHYGTNILVENRALWRRMMDKLPPKLKPTGWTGPNRLTYSRPTLVLTYTESQSKPPRSADRLFWGVADEHGIESPISFQFYSRTPGTNGIYAIPTESFPRRSKKLIFRIHGVGTNLGEVEFKNSFQSTAPPWKADPLPQEQKAGDVTVRFLDAISGVKVPSKNTAKPQMGKRLLETWPGAEEMTSKNTDTMLVLEIESEIPGEKWLVSSIAFEDASGNNVKYQTYTQTYADDGPSYVWITGCLWPVEPIRYRFELTTNISFPSTKAVEFKVQPRALIPPNSAF